MGFGGLDHGAAAGGEPSEAVGKFHGANAVGVFSGADAVPGLQVFLYGCQWSFGGKGFPLFDVYKVFDAEKFL